jgi:hypothetical protein
MKEAEKGEKLFSAFSFLPGKSVFFRKKNLSPI